MGQAPQNCAVHMFYWSYEEKSGRREPLSEYIVDLQLCHVSTHRRQVRRCTPMETLVYKHTYLVFQSLPDRQPVQVISDCQYNLIILSLPDDEACSSIEDRLNGTEINCSSAAKNTVSIVDTPCDERIDKCLRRTVLDLGNVGSSVAAVVGRNTSQIDV